MRNTYKGRRFKDADQQSPMTPRKQVPVDRSQKKAGKKRSPVSIVLTLIIAVVLLIALILGGRFLFHALKPGADQAATRTEAVNVTIPEGAGSQKIANLLYEAHVISSQDEFISQVQSTGEDKKLKPGTFTFAPGLSLSEVITELVSGTGEDGVKLTIPEGYTVEKTADAVEKALNIPAQEFKDQAKASQFSDEYPFLNNAYNDSLEGYLYPKTYHFKEGVSAHDVIRKMLDQYVKETSQLDLTKTPQGLSPQQIMTVASLIERETKIEDERPRVASVIYNRLQKDMLLQIDAAIVYAVGGDITRVTAKDLEVDSPYNVYKHKGLPPGPICSPSLSAIQAALNPEQTNYLYYVMTSKEGTHTFTETYDDFLVAKEEYKRVFGR